jgi:hypothetical protein
MSTLKSGFGYSLTEPFKKALGIPGNAYTESSTPN